VVQRLFVHDTFPWQFIPMRLWESPLCPCSFAPVYC